METKKHTRCQRCGKKLTTPLAQLRGYGNACWKKHQLELSTTSNLFTKFNKKL